MTSRTRKLTVGAVVIAVVVVVLILVAETHGPVAPVTVTLVRYQPGDTSAIIQIVNRKGGLMNYNCWPEYKPNQISAVAQGTIASKTNEILKFVVAIPFATSSIRVNCYAVRSGFIGGVLDELLGIDNFTTNLTLPPPPKTPLP
jgi:hypothetical protein